MMPWCCDSTAADGEIVAGGDAIAVAFEDLDGLFDLTAIAVLRCRSVDAIVAAAADAACSDACLSQKSFTMPHLANRHW